MLPPSKSYRRVEHNLLAEYDRASADDAAFWDGHWRGENLERQLRRAASGSSGGMDFLADGFPAGGRILEGGCGLGQLVAALDSLGFRVEGLDFAAETLREAKSVLPGLALCRGDLRRLPYRDAAFDGYLSLGVIEHFTDPADVAAILGEARRVTRGVAFVSVPHLSPGLLRRVEAGELPAAGDDATFYQYYMTPDRLRGLLEGHGFRVERFEHYATAVGLRRHHPLFRGRPGGSRVGRALTRRLAGPLHRLYGTGWSHMVGAWARRG